MSVWEMKMFIYLFVHLFLCLFIYLFVYLLTPSVRKYKAIRSKNLENIELRKNNIISSSTQPKEEFPCAFYWDSLKLRSIKIFTETSRKEAAKQIAWEKEKAGLIFWNKYFFLCECLGKRWPLILEFSWMKVDCWNSGRNDQRNLLWKIVHQRHQN